MRRRLQKRKPALVANPWQLGNVAAMLERAGDDAARPEWLEPEFGVRDGLYYLTEQQAQAILDSAFAETDRP